AGTVVVRTGQALGTLAICLMEPEAEDGLATWNFFDEGLKEGSDFPVMRLPRPEPLTLCRTRPLTDDRREGRPPPEPRRPITYETMYGGGEHPNFGGSPIGGLTWLDDGEHYLQGRVTPLYKRDAET